MTDVAVVLVALGEHGVPEPAPVGLPRHGGGTSVGDAVDEQLTRRHVDDVEDAVLGAALAQAERHRRTVGGRLEPVDRCGAVGHARRRVEKDPSWCIGIDGRPKDESELVGTTGPLGHEQPVTPDCARRSGGQRNERGKTLEPTFPIGTGIERLSGVLVLVSDPAGDL